MRDPDLMQRADRAAIALEQAWERWRAMHGLGAEPLPPVSSYVGYSLEEPWGQPRVVFGLRADEAEMLASLLDGHDCVGSVYSDVGARLDWRLPSSTPAPLPARGYGSPLSVPAQAPPPGIDLLPPGPPDGFAVGRLGAEDATPAAVPDDDRERHQAPGKAAGSGSARSRAARAARPARTNRRSAETVAEPAEEKAEPDEADWSAPDSETPLADLPADAAALEPEGVESPPLEALPDAPDRQQRSAEPALEPGASQPRAAGGAAAGRGPGYRGPRYQGFPPRYDTGSSSGSAGRPAAPPDDEDDADPAESASGRRSHVSKLSRSARRRTQGG